MTSVVTEALTAAPGQTDERVPLSAPSRLMEALLTGGGTLVALPLCHALPALVGWDTAELAVGFLTFHAAHVINDPHFSVTYLLFYRGLKRKLLGAEVPLAQRARYWLAGVLAPLLLAGWALSALLTRSAASLGAMTQAMFLLVGWHYVKQSFGVLTILSARRGYAYSLHERRVLVGHCFAAWAYAWASPLDPGRHVEEKGVVYFTWPHPGWLEQATRAVFLASALVLAVTLARKWHRERRLSLAPLLGFLCGVWIWTVYSGLDPLFVYVIPALHSVQYLYFVWLLKRGEAHAHEGAPAFGRPVATVLGGYAAAAVIAGLLLFHLVPGSLDAALVDRRAARYSDLGPTPWFAALFTFVNLHHYFMDFALWRRENAETRYLRA
ncbi:MAG: hypothetical protein EOO73_20555 [Myxococcales bacterium]|nr:MAG: hypothetical protein EOO73_20555 [Myxococcales bacterium]